MQDTKRHMPKRLTLKAQIGLGATVIAACLVTIGTLAVTTSRLLERTSQAVLQENVSSLKAAEELELALLDQKGVVSSYLLSGDEQWLRQLEAKRRNFEEWFRKAQAVALTAKERAILTRIRADYTRYDRTRLHVVQLYQQGRIAAAEQLLLHDGQELLGQLYDACEELLLVNEQIMAMAQHRTATRVRWMQAIIWGMIGGAIVIGLGMGWWVTRGFSRRLAQSEKLAALGQIAGVVAHEVRNPLTAIKLRLHSLQTDATQTPATREDLDIIAQEIRRLEDTVHEVLEFARPATPNRQPLQVREVVEGCARFMETTFAERGIRVVTTYEDSALVVHADAAQLKQVFLNLFLNAVDAMPEGGTLRVLSRIVKPLAGRALAEVVVEDSGTGVAATVQARLFEPFVSTKADGTGLGLAVARTILERHEGALVFDAQVVQGARFLIRLPMVEGTT